MEWNWTTLLWIGGFALLFWFMMRGCGGMMRGGGGGGCGMGRSTERPRAGHEETIEDHHEPTSR